MRTCQNFLPAIDCCYVVHGEVVAGIDLAGLLPGNVTIAGSKVSIQLPEAEIFGVRLDNAKTKVYSRDTGLFSSPDPNLESEVREVAENSCRTRRCRTGFSRPRRKTREARF